MNQEEKLNKALPNQSAQDAYRMMYSFLSDPDRHIGSIEKRVLLGMLQLLIEPSPKHRPRDSGVQLKMSCVFLLYRWSRDVEGWPGEAAKKRCAELYNVSTRSVEIYIRKMRAIDFESKSGKAASTVNAFVAEMLEQHKAHLKGQPTLVTAKQIEHFYLVESPKHFAGIRN